MTLLRVKDLRTHFRDDGRPQETRAAPASEPDARAVDGISFEVDRGEAVGIVGESGCGKTVTALSLMGLVAPPGRILPGSSIRLDGREMVGLPERELRRIRGARLGMIFQEPSTSLNPVYTVGDQVREALALHRGARRREARRLAVELLGEVGLPDPERRYRDYPHELSGGMRQRVMIAIALSGRPDLLIGDEPTTALDVTIQAQILSLLSRLRRGGKMALLLITHDLGVVAEVCDRVIVMYAGQVVETGTVHDVLTSPRHPYTRGLLASLPRLDAPETRLRAIPGTVPGATTRFVGCRFRDRCSEAFDRCADAPRLHLVPGTPGRTSRCWLDSPSGSTAPSGERRSD